MTAIFQYFRETISALKRKFLHGSPAITVEKKISNLIAGLPYYKKVSAVEIASRKSLAINIKTSSISDSQVFFFNKKRLSLLSLELSPDFVDFRTLILA